MASPEYYQYQPLQPDEDIRLLTINPATSLEDEVSCSLRHVRFSDLPDRDPPNGETRRFRVDPSVTSVKVKTYNALSYAWGLVYEDGSHLSERIVCDGKLLKITANLHKALRYYRSNVRKLPRVMDADHAVDC